MTTDAIEIAPPCPPIDRIPSLSAAARRIYVTATLPDDSVLVTHFDADPESISTPITPKTADDLGERMILTPLETHPGTGEVAVIEFLADEAQKHNVVVIVPSHRRAKLWEPFADAVHDSKTIEMGVQALREGHVGLVVLVNKYDGIDLPGDACRILALDGLPEAYGPLDRLAASALQDSEAMVTRQVQRIEQGMGRGVRSNDDYCVVLLLGSRLTERLHSARAAARFSLATKAQIELSRQVAELLHGKPFSDLSHVINQCLERDNDWITASRGALDGVRYEQVTRVSPIAIAERRAFDLALLGRHEQAATTLLEAADSTSDLRLRGWLKQQAATYRHFADPAEAQRLQASAQMDNRALLRPRSGVSYTRMPSVADQAEEASGFLRSRYAFGDDLVIGVAALLEDLTPHPETAEKFEQAVFDLGRHLGFGSQRPERDIGEGPDVLWQLGGLKFLVIECKSGTTTDFISRRDAAQISHSMDWFQDKYDQSCKAVPLLIHNTRQLHKSATARQGLRVMTFEKLRLLRQAVQAYATAVGPDGRYQDVSEVGRRLAAHDLAASGFADHWGQSPRKS